MKHTHSPGPFKIDYDLKPFNICIRSAQGRVIAEVSIHHAQEADAHLFSAAAEMLEALESAQRLIKETYGCGNPQIAEIIAKARGQSNEALIREVESTASALMDRE